MHSSFRRHGGSKRGRAALLLLVLGLVSIAAPGRIVRGAPPLTAADFEQEGPQGLDPNYENGRQNSWAWSMKWWRGHLYVGVMRAYACASRYAFSLGNPLLPYPPPDPDLSCPPNPEDIPMRAEIWRWTPPPAAGDSRAQGTWDRVYQSPPEIDIVLPDGKRIPQDVGYRGMSVFTEPDGTEALYVSAVTARYMGYRTAPPRILRSTDGVTFTPIPQDPGTYMGSLSYNGFRGSITYKGRFYIVAGSIDGPGVLLESSNPAAGDNAFREVSPPNTLIFETQPFNGYLYIGISDDINGFRVAKTDAVAQPPTNSCPSPCYTYTTVMANGGDAPIYPNQDVLSMRVFNNYLYVGGNGLPNPAELFRIAPDDSWDVVVGYARGAKAPLSGLGPGFNNSYNVHMWRMQVFDNTLYVGTFDNSVNEKDTFLEPSLRPIMGGDLWRSSDGVTFDAVTKTAFLSNDPSQGPNRGVFDAGFRSLEATPYGFFAGTANQFYGLRVWRADPQGYQGFRTYVPLTLRSP